MTEKESTQPGREPGPEQSAQAQPPGDRPEEERWSAAHAVPPPAQPAPPPAQPPPPRRPPRTVRVWLAAAIGALLLLGGGVSGYFIGAATDHDRPGFSRFGDHRPDDRNFPQRGDR